MTEQPTPESLNTQQQDSQTTLPWPETLKQYLQQNKRQFKDFASENNIPETSLRHWMRNSGKTALYKARNPEAFQKLYEATHIQELQPAPSLTTNTWPTQLKKYIQQTGIPIKEYTSHTLGVHPSTFWGWLRDPEKLHIFKAANPAAFQKLYEETHIEALNPQHLFLTNDPLQRMDAKLDKILSEISTLQRAPLPPPPTLPCPTEPLVKETKKQFYTLLEKLEQFKQASLENAREQLMQSIPARDVGYITALLNALYQPNDKFRAFLLSSAYTPGGRS